MKNLFADCSSFPKAIAQLIASIRFHGRGLVRLICSICVILSIAWLQADAAVAAKPVGEPGEGSNPGECLADTTVAFSVSPTTAVFGQPVTLHWNITPTPECGRMTQSISGIGPVEPSGSVVQHPSDSTVWILQGRLGKAGRELASASIRVTYPSRVVIDRNTPHPGRVLIGALTSSNPEQIVELCDVDIDLTGHVGIAIGDNRSLIASPACARGPRSLGPRVFVTDKRNSVSALFEIQGDNVRISGFRLQGPTEDIGKGDDVLEKAILIYPVGGANPTSPIRNIEISNMEIFHWSGVGIAVNDIIEFAERGRLFNTNPNAVRIRENFMHHNRHAGGNGYGVDVSRGAYALIERNVFDENRHAIAGGSKNDNGPDYSGYTVRDNLILAGGGEHCSEHWAWGATGWTNLWPRCWQTHQIDMHGDQNAWYSDANWQCGTAGETMIIERNTILYTAGNAIKIRGNPLDKVVVDHNIFSHGERNSAITQNGACGLFGDNITKPIDVRPNNLFGVDPTSELGSCDFFGDGQQDQFMATGVTWWAKSPITQQWRYLNTMSERLPELQLGDVDRDGKCDVSLRSANKYSQGGQGPWTSVLGHTPLNLPPVNEILELK